MGMRGRHLEMAARLDVLAGNYIGWDGGNHRNLELTSTWNHISLDFEMYESILLLLKPGFSGSR